MFQELLELLKRFVAAQEMQAEAAMLMAAPQPNYDRTTSTGQVPTGPEVSDGTECAATSHASGSEATTAQREVEGKNGVEWSPYTSPIQGRYGKDKTEILDAELKARGISIKASATGAEKHQALLDCDKDLDLDPKTQAEEKVEEPTSLAAQPATIDDVRALAQAKVKDGMTPAQVQEIFKEIGGSIRLPEINEQHMPEIYAKLTAAAAVKKG